MTAPKPIIPNFYFDVPDESLTFYRVQSLDKDILLKDNEIITVLFKVSNGWDLIGRHDNLSS